MTNTHIGGYRLSQQQGRLWNLQGDKNIYQSQCAIFIRGNVELSELKSIFQKILSQHEILCTKIKKVSGIGEPIQVIDKNYTPKWNDITVPTTDQIDQDRVIEEHMVKERNSLMIKNSGHIRLLLVTFDEDVHVLLLTMSSLHADAWTLNNLFSELCKHLSERKVNVDEEQIQYSQYSEFQHELLNEEDALEGLNYWKRNKLNNISFENPIEENKSDLESFIPKVHSRKFDSSLLSRLTRVALENKVSIEELLYAFTQVLVCKITNQRDVVTGFVSNGRKYEEFHEMLGLFNKTLPIQTRIDLDDTFLDLLGQIHKSTRQAHLWQEYLLSNESFYSILFKYDEYSNNVTLNSHKLAMNKQFVINDRFHIKFNWLIIKNELHIQVYFDPQRYPIDAIEALLNYYLNIINDILDNPQVSIDRISVPDMNWGFAGEKENNREVEIDGVKINLNKIVKVLKQHPIINDAEVMINKNNNKTTLTAYLVSKHNQIRSNHLIKSYLLKEFPQYVITYEFIWMDSKSEIIKHLNESGKSLDNGLNRHEHNDMEQRAFVSPKTETEKKITEIWIEVLGVEQISTQDVFFEIGGDSLKSVKVHFLISKHYNNVNLVDLFKYSTIKELSSYIDKSNNSIGLEDKVDGFTL
ncbi:condensation domain-containing protein [Peribacillus frigoritolerans]|uniref:condensation domain-containing protein n=1 Tax=Peribacillus frigoritolerans TaxID=450367 RepID=UPI002EA7351A|nr:condensation domain-containing protein [Peribacillus frigoritolerans]